jgi:capsular polysaccharide export protein
VDGAVRQHALQANNSIEKTAPIVRRCAVAFSAGIRNIRHIHRLLDVDAVVSPAAVDQFDGAVSSVLVWGRKSNTAEALRYAENHELRVLYLEDGWIRSSAQQAHSRTSYSLLVDSSGVYYDSRTPSAVEEFLNLDRDAFDRHCTPEQLNYAASCRADIVANDITKYNYCSTSSFLTGDKPVVLVVDQTRDDASLVYGGMDAERFAMMLQAAQDENPHAEIVVRTHPDVVSGRRKGYLGELATTPGIRLSVGGDNPLALLKQAERIYVGTSQLGFEALLCERPVVVFGQPFYAGWGLTDDRQPVRRRIRQRSIDQLLHASHVHLARYCNPVTGERWQLHQCIEHVKLQRRMFARNARDYYCVGIAPWKRRYISQYLRSPDGTVNFSEPPLINGTDRQRVVTWGFRRYSTVAHVTANANGNDVSGEDVSGGRGPDGQALVSRIEDGFLRSTGLGSDFNAPASLVIDSRGLYLDPARPSDLEHLLNHHDCAPADIGRAVRLRKLIGSSRVSKYNVGVTGNVLTLPADRQVVLVVGQVEDDQSVRRGCDRVASNGSLLAAVRAARPEAWILYKPHPDVVAGNRKGQVSAAIVSACADAVEADTSIVDCIDACDELHTMTSLSGFEALLRGKPVVTYGAPFYSGWGLTEDHQPVARRVRRRTLDELVYMTLIEYPTYVDIETGEFMTPEDLVFTLNSQREMNKNNNKPASWPVRQLGKVVNIGRGLRYAP